jgi:hypothetical protein
VNIQTIKNINYYRHLWQSYNQFECCTGVCGEIFRPLRK